MILRLIARAAATGLFLTSGTEFAAAQTDEIIVTGTRISDSGLEEPYITMKRRPDNVVMSVSVICDTRDNVLRLQELQQTMSRVIDAAKRNPAIDMGLLVEREDVDGNDITFIKPYDPEKFGDYVTGGFRSDTSAVNLVLKTKVVDAYKTEDDALAVLEGFIDSIETVGRTEVVSTDDPVLSIIRPGQYRYALVEDIAKDANRVAKAFGADYRVNVKGLQAPIVFYQTDALELTLFVPYAFDVVHSE